jgi:gamma-glutamylcyclotransferase (GGCT)/AIG2-like uncharacterized protein YtfP
LNVLDEYEEYNAEKQDESLFVREQVKVTLKGKEIETYAYLYNKKIDPLTRIASGDYVKG